MPFITNYKTVPKSIISTVPSLTELLFYFGLGDKILGVTKFCVHPIQAKQQCTIIGGTKNLRVQKIIDLKPELIIANKEENIKTEIETLANYTNVLLTDITTIQDALNAISLIGEVTQQIDKANNLLFEINESFKQIQKANKTVVYLIWKNPYMAAGTDTFINNMLNIAGYTNLVTNMRYPIITIEQLKQLAPDVLMLSSEPYPFKDIHITELQAILPNTKISLVDGEIFSWYGSRMLHAEKYFSTLHF
jgi:ABC-type Fe3+-hydroxamate transport system substrate-binding protein